MFSAALTDYPFLKLSATKVTILTQTVTPNSKGKENSSTTNT
jgi:hypothetical protein